MPGPMAVLPRIVNPPLTLRMTMKRLTVRSCRVAATAALCLTAAMRLSAQAAAPAADSNANQEPDKAIVLSPFVVEATEDSGYSAKDTLAGTRVRTELRDVASSISVVTSQFLKDTGSHNSLDLLTYTPNTEVGGLKGNFSGQGGNITYAEPLTNPNNNNRVRGLDSADNTRDYFLTDIPWDSYNVGRVDLQRGPNSILFGVGSPSGIINASLNSAAFKNAYHVENVTSQYGSQRQVVDLNFVVVPDTLAIRFAMLDDKQKFQQDPAFNNSRRYYGALRFDPKIFGEGNQTSIRANIEHGEVSSNNPRTIPPDDQITRFFQSGPDAYGNAGPNKTVIDQFQTGYQAGGILANNIYPTKSWQQGRLYWPTPVIYYNGSNPNTPGVAPVSSSNPTQEIVGQLTTGWAINSAGQIAPPNQPGQGTNIGIGGLPTLSSLAVEPFSHYAATSIPGGSYFADHVLTDTSIFNFYDQLLDGPNKREWQNWDAFNIAVSQTFLDGRVGFEAAYDKQTYNSGNINALTGENYGIGIDVNQVLINGALNPNVGRPYVANAFDNSSNSAKITRDSSRLTAYAELRAEDFLGKGLLAKILGRHVFTGLYALDHKTQQNISWSQYAASPDWESDNNFDLSVKIANYRLFNFVDYLGPTLLGASSAAGANLTNMQNLIAAPQNSNVTWFDSHWKYSLNPGSPDYVDPAATYTYPDHDTGVTVNSTQSNNPANYVGWSHLPVTWLDASNPDDFRSLVTGGVKTRFRDQSEGLIYQGYFLDGDLVPTYGWRKDRIVNYATNAPINLATSIAASDYVDDPNSRLATEGQTRTWGVVYHVAKALMKHVPGDTSLSVFYNKSHNFKADAPREDLFGEQIGNPDGDTKEYGAMLTTLSDKISLKVTHYQTTVHNATLQSDALAGLGGLGYLLDLIPAWGYGYAAQVQLGLDGKYGNTTLNGPGDTAGGTSWNYVARDAVVGNPNADMSVIGTPAGAANLPVATYGYGGTGSVSMTDIVNAWINMPVPPSFFDFFGITGNRPIPTLMRSTGKIYLGFSQPAVGSNFPGVGGQQPSLASALVSTED
ncbi:MAG TPA: TonB-dependent receptor plug domain-containing protein, partial [Candidatus Didemnitutus sp.]